MAKTEATCNAADHIYTCVAIIAITDQSWCISRAVSLIGIQFCLYFLFALNLCCIRVGFVYLVNM